MTKDNKPNSRKIDDINIHKVLAKRGRVADIWWIEDVLTVRPDLSRNQAWDVLQLCVRRLDSAFGFTWNLVGAAADDLFPTHTLKNN